ncbi:MAG: TadE/TadG family type IV pilus assembly protein [Eubacterium sp.]|uniref:TadE/TadG family type IV pilus assembly protein n=1 Tax=Eubacterium ramulus TaxID=39490 RepID=UPI0039964FEE
MLLPKKQNKKNYKSLSGIYLKSRHESPANSSDKSESVNCAKALQYARLPGSLTVEAAFVVPWIILAAIVLCSLFSVLRGELYMSAALHNAARIMAAEVTEIEHKENISDDVPADTNIVSHIRLRYLVQKELRGMGWKEEENSGMISEISFRDSNFSGDEIIACVSYQICMPVSFGQWGNLPVKHQVVCKKWTGRKEHGSGTGDSEYVFVTPYGTAYHVSLSCPYLDLSVKSVSEAGVKSLRNKDGGIYYPCSCVKHKNSNVYVTDYGTFYHENPGCYRLKRSVSKIFRSETGSRHPCNKCTTYAK